MTVYYPQAAMTLRVTFENFRNDADFILNEVYTMRITPKSVNVNINDYTQADTFSAEVDYKNFPFDPRSIRSIGATVHMANVEHIVNEYGEVEQLVPAGTGNSIIEESTQNVVFMGFADEDNIRLDEASRTVRFEGRDFTALLIDTPFDMGSLDLFRPLTVVLRQILANLEATRNIYVLNKTGEILPTIGQFAPAYTPLAATKNKKRNETYWDVIQDLVGRAGLIAYIELDKLVVAKPRALFDESESKQFIYGKNITNLELKRKIGRLKDNNVRVLSLNLEQKEVIQADIPREAGASWRRALGLLSGDVKRTRLKPLADGSMSEVKETAPFLTFRVPNIASKSQLTEIGQNIYEEMGRQQIEGSFETREMAICDKSNIGYPKEFNVTKIRNATPIEIEIHHEDLEGIRRVDSLAARTQYLIDKCYDTRIAQALATAMGKLGTPFYTKAVEFRFDSQRGFTMKLDFINQIEISDSLLGL
jgi:hypothetical protein